MFNLQTFQEKVKSSFSSLFKQNKYENLLQSYMQDSANNPDDMRIKIKIAETYFRAKNLAQAIATYQEVSTYYLENNFILKAVAIYKNILSLDPTLIDINLKLADLYLKLEMTADAGNQYRIAIHFFQSKGEKEKILELTKKLVDIEPTAANRRKYAETLQAQGLTKEAMVEYEKLGLMYRASKDYDNLLRIYELILPYKSENQSMIKDVCILYLRRSEPDHAIKILERYKLDADPAFTNLYEKGKAMKKLLRGQTTG